MTRIVLATLFFSFALLVGGVRGDPPDSLRVRCTWMPPETGSVPVLYHLQIQDPRAMSAFDTTYVVPHLGGEERQLQMFNFLDGDYWEVYRARVRAMDAQGRLGPWSSWSIEVVFEVPDPEP